MYDEEAPLVIRKAVGWLAGILGVLLTMMLLYIVYDALKGSPNYGALSVLCAIGMCTIAFLMLVAYRLTEDIDHRAGNARGTLLPRFYFVIFKYLFLVVGLSILVIGLKYSIAVRYDARIVPGIILTACLSMLLSYCCHYLLKHR